LTASEPLALLSLSAKSTRREQTAEKGELKVRLIKMLGLAAIAAMAAMALVGVTSASATSTQLCTAHTGLTCSSPASSIHLVNEGVFRLLNELNPVLCLNVLIDATPLALGSPQSLHASSLALENCGTNSTHDNCEITVEELPLFNLLKTGLDEGSLTATNGQIYVICEQVLGWMTIECTFDSTGLLLAVAAGHATANQTPITEVGNSPLCPSQRRIDGLLKGLSAAYVLG